MAHCSNLTILIVGGYLSKNEVKGQAGPPLAENQHLSFTSI